MRAQMDLRKRKLNEGAHQIGWKVGFGAPTAKEKFNLTTPLVGFLLDRAVLSSGAAVAIGGWRKPAAEAEIAAYIGHDLPARASRDDTRKAIVAIGPAIELADVDGPMDDVERVLACDIFQRHVVLGPRDIMRGGARLNGVKGRLSRSGADIPVPADLQTNIGDVIDIVRHVADMAAAVADGLRAGQFIITGSLTAPMMLDRDDRGIDFALDPIGSVSVRLSSG
jgi:2-keto-4-pentenoate hydratase